MTEAFTLSLPNGRALASFVNCQIDRAANRWLGGHGMHVVGAVAYSPMATTAKRYHPGTLVGGLT